MPEYADLMSKRFISGGRGPDEFDCYGLVRELLRRETPSIAAPDGLTPCDQLGRSLVITGAIADPRLWVKVDRRPGAIGLYRIKGLASHVSYLLDDYYMLHCWQGSKVVVRERIADWEHRLVAYYRPAGYP